MKYVVCFDIGGTNVKYAIIDINKQICEQGTFETSIDNGELLLKKLSTVISDYTERYSVIGITISCPGFVNSKLGVIESGTIIDGFNGFNIKEYFEEKYGIPVAVENDANCATIAEHVLGNGKGCENLVCLTLGTGVGGGIIINNQIYTGNHFMAGEFGFMFINGLHSQQPENDIFSNFASTRALVEKTSYDLNEQMNGVMVYERAQSGNEICQQNIEQFYKYLAMGIYNICYILNPDKVLIGGAISRQKDLISSVKEHIDRLTPSFSKSLLTISDFDTCKFYNDAGVMGSFCNFMNQYGGEF